MKREPFWADTIIYSGSLLVISGITILFYGRAIAQKMQVTPPGVHRGLKTPALILQID
ncbi:MAG: hypothetical protein AB4352_20085 [Hormoscilla sp.]